MNFKYLFYMSLILTFSLYARAEPAHPDSTFTLSLVTASRGGYVFRGSDPTQISNVGLITGKNYSDAGKSYAFRPYGVELESRVPVTGASGSSFNFSARMVPMGLRLTPSHAEQSGVDGFITAAYGFLSELSPECFIGFDAGFRVRRWQLESGVLPSTNHAGLILVARVEGTHWNALFEAGLMGAGLGTPASLGVQRDSSTLRARVGYHFAKHPFQLSPWIEFFHTHRDFYGAALLPGEGALFVDEASLIFGVGVRL